MGSLKSFIAGLIAPGNPTRLTETPLRGSGRLPKNWTRDYVTIETQGPMGKEVFNVTRDLRGHTYWRDGRPHRLIARDKTWQAKDHVHLTPKGVLRDSSSGIARRLGIKHSNVMKALPRTGLSSKALQRDLDAGAARVIRGNVVANDTWKAHGFGNEVKGVFGRQADELHALSVTAQRLEYTAKAMVRDATKRTRGLSSAAREAKSAWATAARDAEFLARRAGDLNERAALKAIAAGEASVKAAAAAAEAQAKAAAAAAEKASKEAAKAAEVAAKEAARLAEVAAKTAASAGEAAVKAAAAAAEATAKASLALAEATAKGIAYTAAAAASAVAAAFDR